MSTYAIGDVQGCYRALSNLLREIGFVPSRDDLWFVGDLVNRGPNSRDVLACVRDLGAAAVTVLGNHDLHLLMVAEGLADPLPGDTLSDVLDAPDHVELLTWLRQQPLMVEDCGYVLVHAGLHPQWTVSQAAAHARAAERLLQSASYRTFLKDLAQTDFLDWSDQSPEAVHTAMATHMLVRLRVCSASGNLNTSFTGPPDLAPPGFMPWFDVPDRRSSDHTVVFGHWAALGLLLRPDVIALDSGCVWGKHLSAVRIEDRRVYQVTCSGS